MEYKKVKTLFLIILVIVISATALTVASIGRFTRTHAIVGQSNCTDCHADAFIDMNYSWHIGAMGPNQSITMDYYFRMRNETDINGLCFSCHNVRKEEFVFKDPYISGNTTAIYGLGFLGSGLFTGTANETVSVNIEVMSVSPANSTVSVDATILLMNFSGHQDPAAISTNLAQVLPQGGSFTISRTSVYGDYFRVYISTSGDWNSSVLNVSVDGYPSVIISSGNGSSLNYYSLPSDFQLQYMYLSYFHTRGAYIEEPMSETLARMRNSSVATISFYEPMTDDLSNITRYTCSSPDAMCHINTRMAVMGQTEGISGGGKYYSHALSYSTGVCRNCHID